MNISLAVLSDFRMNPAEKASWVLKKGKIICWEGKKSKKSSQI
jgi:hypothetical protein